MKRILLVMVLLAQVALAGVALANTVTVDFSVLGINVIDITAQSYGPGYTGYPLNGISFLYDNQGNTGNFASVDQNGIFGTYNGALLFNFNAPAIALNFNFELLGTPGSVSDSLFALFSNGGVVGPVSTVPVDAFGTLAGSLAYSGAPFDQATMYFSIDAPYFTVADITYQPAPIPGALPLVGSGLLILANYRRRKLAANN